MVLWIGVDDTDSLRGMCTTFLATELVRELTRGSDLIGFPRLVRLNPNIAWKTRGNGAICVRIGHGRGVPWRVGSIDGEAILAFPRGDGSPDLASAAASVAQIVEQWSCFADPTTHPGFVVLSRQPTARLYWRAVREIVELGEALEASRSLGIVKGYKEGRGIVGAAASTAWRPRDRTYEILAYRSPDRWGSSRDVAAASVVDMDQRFPSTFNNFDYDEGRVVITPRSPCPVLCGIRGDDPTVLPSALSCLRGELPDRWLVFETNQGTDDHVLRRGKPTPLRTVRLQGEVTRAPRTLAGGHVVFQMGGLDVSAYEPSKRFRHVVRLLAVGDQVEVIGAVRETPRTINLEKIQVLRLAPVVRKIANPACPSCGKRMKSCGRDAPYRCSRCRTKVPRGEAIVETVDRVLEPGWYEPPVGSRRHLTMPLRRMVSLGAGRPSRQAGRPGRRRNQARETVPG